MVRTTPSPGWGPQGQGPGKNRQGPGMTEAQYLPKLREEGGSRGGPRNPPEKSVRILYSIGGLL